MSSLQRMVLRVVSRPMAWRRAGRPERPGPVRSCPGPPGCYHARGTTNRPRSRQGSVLLPENASGPIVVRKEDRMGSSKFIKTPKLGVVLQLTEMPAPDAAAGRSWEIHDIERNRGFR